MSWPHLPSPRVAHPTWFGVILAGLVLLGLGLVLGHVALAPALDHADCLFCHLADQILPVAVAAAVAILGARTRRCARPHAFPCSPAALAFHGRAPPVSPLS